VVTATRTYGRVELAGDVYAITAEPHVMIRLKRIFPKVDRHRTGTITLRATPENSADLEWVMARWPLETDSSTADVLLAQADAYRENQSTILSILGGDPPKLDLTSLALPLRDYQQEAVALVATTGRLLLLDDVGLGKTAVALGLLAVPDALPAAVVTLTHLPPQWLSELNRFLPTVRGHIAKKGRPYNLTRAGGPPDVLILNYSKLAGWADHLAGNVKTIVFDEMQELRIDGSGKYVAAAQVADQARFRLGLTATPVYNYGGEIYNVLDCLQKDCLGARDEFNREWGTGSSSKVRVNDPVALGTTLRENGLVLRRTRKDVKRELPDVQRIHYPVEIDQDTFESGIEGAELLAKMIVERAGSPKDLFKAAGDFDWRLRQATGIAKARYVADFARLILETEQPLVLFGWHHAVYDIWRDRLADHRPVFYTGEESVPQKEAAKHQFLEGGTDLLIMSLRAGAGLDGLQERCSICVFGELDWSPGVHTQAIGRLHRDGQDNPVVAYFLVAEEGSDPAIAEVLDLKRQQAEGIVDPQRPLFEALASGGEDRIQLLAQTFLRRRS
jgi:SNF2 family DNA or RNA helicase